MPGATLTHQSWWPPRRCKPHQPVHPRALSSEEVEQQIADYVRCATLAQQAGYDGVEVMGSEGYLINQFICRRTNQRDDDWGGDFERRMRFPVEIVKRIRQAVGERFLLIFRLSMIDLVEEGSSWEEVVQLGQAIEALARTSSIPALAGTRHGCRPS
ncbi:hypothetical protein HAALTHF_27060n [Vreelandella aquamarina]|nr:hypothetical protein HAALTHF_27060n [Halomonas axialensis]